MQDWHWSKSKDPSSVIERARESRLKLEAEKAKAKGYSEDRECERCGQVFGRKVLSTTRKRESWTSYNRRRFCSRSCMAKAREASFGHASTEKTCEQCGGTFQVRGANRKAAVRAFCSMACREAAGGFSMHGSDHPNWRGGVTEENVRLRNGTRYIEWRNAVYRRDGWTCQRCGVKCRDKKRGKRSGDDIVAHHIKGFREYPELRYDVANGETLCRRCHKREHYSIGEGHRFTGGRAGQPLPEAQRAAIAEATRKRATEYAESNGFTEDRRCIHCGEIFERTRSKSGRIEPWLTYNKRQYCGHSCRQQHRYASSTKAERSAAGAKSQGFKEDKRCEQCGAQFFRAKGGPKGTIEAWAGYLRRRFCSPKCGAIAREAKRKSIKLNV